MSENEDKKESQEEIDERLEKQKANQAAKFDAIKKVRTISNPDSQWTLTQELLQEVMATYIIRDPKSMPKVPTLLEDLRKEINLRYKEDPEMCSLLLDSIPHDKYVRQWIKKDGWEAAVWGKIRVDGLFTVSKRAEVIEALRMRAIDKSDMAAKLYLTMSGDYTEKTEINDKTVDTYREINKILHKKEKE